MRGFPRARWVAGAAVTAIALTGLTGCGGGSGDQPVRVQLSEPQHDLVPTNTAETNGAEVLNALYVGLVDYDAKNNPVERVAKSITSTDNKVWTIKIKDGYTFHNGEKVTAESFVDAWNYGALQDNAQEAQPFFSRIAGFEAVSPGKGKTPAAKSLSGLKVVNATTFTVTLTEAFNQFKTMLGYTAFYPQSKAFFTDPKKYGESPVGNGPFQMEAPYKRGTDTTIKVKRYDGFKEGKAKVDKVEFRLYTDLNTAWNDLRSGSLDIIDQLPATAVATAKAELGDRYVDQPSSGVGYIGFPLATNPAYGKPEVRKAVSMAIDRKAITDKVFSGTRAPADDFINPLVDGYRQGACGDPCTYNPTKAKELYTQSGGLPGNKIELGYNGDGGHKEWMEAVANNLRANLGLEVSVKPFPKFAQVLTDLGDKKYLGAFRMAWIMDYPAAENYLKPIFSKSAIENGSNYGGYDNPAFDKLLAEAGTKKTVAEAVKTYQKADDILLNEMPYIPVYFYRTNYGFSKHVKNVKVDAYERIDLFHIEKA